MNKIIVRVTTNDNGDITSLDFGGSKRISMDKYMDLQTRKYRNLFLDEKLTLPKAELEMPFDELDDFCFREFYERIVDILRDEGQLANKALERGEKLNENTLDRLARAFSYAKENLDRYHETYDKVNFLITPLV